MKNNNHIPENFEEIGLQIIRKFKGFSSSGKQKSLKRIDEMIAGESDAEIAELLEDFKSILEKEGEK